MMGLNKSIKYNYENSFMPPGVAATHLITVRSSNIEIRDDRLREKIDGRRILSEH